MAHGTPGDLDSTGKALYRNLKSAMQDREGPTQWQDQDHHLLAQACHYNQRARFARDFFKKRDASDMTTMGDRKQLTVHPLVKVAEQAERAFVECLRELGFTPRARSQLKLEARSEAVSKFGLD